MKRNGFTLLELLVTMSIVLIVLSVGVPGFQGMIKDNRLVSQTNEFVTAVNLARSAAVRFQRNATICVTADYTAAVPACAGGTDWSQGWVVWVDKDRNGAPAANEVLTVHEPLPDTITFTSGATGQFSFDARGFGTAAADALTLCDDRGGEMGRVVNVNAMGRTNVSRQGCG